MKKPKIFVERGGLRDSVPHFVTGWIFPGVEALGPETFDPEYLIPYLLPKQMEGGRVKGVQVLNHLEETVIIRRTMNFDEGRAMIKQGIPDAFRGKHLLLWRSAAHDNFGNQFVPRIQNIEGQTPVIYWHWLEYDLFSVHSAPLFAEQ